MSKTYERNTQPWLVWCWWKRKHRYYYDLREDLDVTVYAESKSVDEESGSFPVFDTTSMTSPAITPSNTSASYQYVVSPDSSIETVLEESPPIMSIPKHTKKKRAVNKRGKKKKSKPLSKEFLESYVRNPLSEGSLESIDSLAESYFDPDELDDTSASQVTPIRANKYKPKKVKTISLADEKFLHYHVHFMRAQTKPREVEVVWAPPENQNSKRQIL